MRPTVRCLAPVLTGLLLVGCGDKSKEAAANADDGSVLSPYLAIGTTLAADKVDGLPELAAKVVKAAESHKDDPGMDAVLQGAGRVGAADIATARDAFKKMSGGMIEYMRANKDKQAGHMIVHCTMTFEGNGGLWVQTEGKVNNPYEGAMMLTCGDKLAWDADLPET